MCTLILHHVYTFNFAAKLLHFLLFIDSLLQLFKFIALIYLFYNCISIWHDTKLLFCVIDTIIVYLFCFSDTVEKTDSTVSSIFSLKITELQIEIYKCITFIPNLINTKSRRCYEPCSLRKLI